MQTTTPIWAYEVVTKRGLLSIDLKDEDGDPILTDSGDQAKRKFRVKRVYLVLKNLKYGKEVVYNVNKPNKSKLVPFFTHKKTKQQFLASIMVEHLRCDFGREAAYIVKEAIDNL